MQPTSQFDPIVLAGQVEDLELVQENWQYPANLMVRVGDILTVLSREGIEDVDYRVAMTDLAILVAKLKAFTLGSNFEGILDAIELRVEELGIVTFHQHPLSPRNKAFVALVEYGLETYYLLKRLDEDIIDRSLKMDLMTAEIYLQSVSFAWNATRGKRPDVHLVLLWSNFRRLLQIWPGLREKVGRKASVCSGEVKANLERLLVVVDEFSIFFYQSES